MDFQVLVLPSSDGCDSSWWVTVIENAAWARAAVLLNDGSQVKGAGTETITITGVGFMVRHNAVQDRIEAGTFMVAAAMTGGDVLEQRRCLGAQPSLDCQLLEMGWKWQRETEEFEFALN